MVIVPSVPNVSVAIAAVGAIATAVGLSVPPLLLLYRSPSATGPNRMPAKARTADSPKDVVAVDDRPNSVLTLDTAIAPEVGVVTDYGPGAGLGSTGGAQGIGLSSSAASATIL